MESYRELKVWQKGIELVKEVYRLTGSYPKTEVYAIVAQMKRASLSVPANIAEGWSRKTKEFLRFIQIAKGSLLELETYLIISRELGFIPEAEEKRLMQICQELGKMIQSMTAALEKKLRRE